MTSAGYAHFADALVFVHGQRAYAEAARHAELAERMGDQETACVWRKAMQTMRADRPKITARAA
jgi:hypothetical protein